MRKAKVGLVGCGFISEVYLRNLTRVFSNTEVVAVTDIVEENARRRAEQFHIPVVCKTTKELLQRDDRSAWWCSRGTRHRRLSPRRGLQLQIEQRDDQDISAGVRFVPLPDLCECV